MIEIKFSYEGRIIPLQCNRNEKMKDIFDKIELKIKNNSVFYLYKGKQINTELKLEEIIKNDDINNINILINSIDKTTINNKIIKSKFVQCPECKENIRIKFNDYKIKLYDCKNGHNIKNILLEKYENTQEIDISKIICNICKINNKGHTFNNNFFVCNTCKENICPLCKSKHDKEHKIINYEQKDYICDMHNELYIKYCTTCKKNICLSCHNLHKEHIKIQYEDIIPDMNEVGNKMNRLKNSIDIFKNDIKIIINQLNKVIENLDIYYNLGNNMIKNYESKNRNYEILQNINEINNNNNIIINDINNINKDNNIINKLKAILNIYKKMKNIEIIEDKKIADTDKNLNLMNNMNIMNNNMNNMNFMNNINRVNNNMNNMNNMNFMNNINRVNNNINNFSFNNQNNMNNQINPPILQQNIINNNIRNFGTPNQIKQNNLVYPHKTGLENIGSLSYMNSTIQCLSNIKYLSYYLINHFGKFDVSDQPLAVAFSSVVYDLFTTDKKYFYPILFKKIIGCLNPLFKGNHESDSKDFIIFILEKLHQELNKKTNYSEQSNIDYIQFEKDSFDKNKMFQHFMIFLIIIY